MDNEQNLAKELTDDTILRKAALILRKKIDRIPARSNYPSPNEVSLNDSRSFVPTSLRTFILWLLDKSALFNSVTETQNPEIDRYSITLSECIIFCARRGRNAITPPFHYGLMLELHHKYGKKLLIQTINAYGFCAPYDELRYLLTAIAEKELQNNKTIYVPSEIVKKSEGGCIIQEGDDNVDWNTGTIDGKNTYHAMARVLFQTVDMKYKPKFEELPKQSMNRALKENNVLFKVSTYQPPSIRPVPLPRIGALNAVKKIIQTQRNFLSNDL